jgi:hypothetical protein
MKTAPSVPHDTRVGAAEAAGLTTNVVPWLCDPASRRVCPVLPEQFFDDKNNFGAGQKPLEWAPDYYLLGVSRTAGPDQPTGGPVATSEIYLIRSKILKIGI